MLSTELAFIHSNKTAKYNYKYLDKDGTVYIGLKDGRLKREEPKTLTRTDISNLDITVSWGNITGSITNQLDLAPYIVELIGSTIKGRAGDIHYKPSSSGYEIQNAVLPFLLMGC